MGYSTPESKVQKKILDYLTDLEKDGHPLFHEVRTGQGGINQRKGRADIFFVYNGIHAEVEVKSLDGKRSSMQDKWEYKCELFNILYCCPHSFDEFKNWFDENFLK